MFRPRTPLVVRQKLKGEHDPEDEFIDEENTKRVGERLSDITTRKVIVVRGASEGASKPWRGPHLRSNWNCVPVPAQGVLIIILPMPLFDVSFWPDGETPTFADTGVRILHDVAAECNRTLALFPTSPCHESLLHDMDIWTTYAASSKVELGALQIYGTDYSHRYGALSLRRGRNLRRGPPRQLLRDDSLRHCGEDPANYDCAAAHPTDPHPPRQATAASTPWRATARTSCSGRSRGTSTTRRTRTQSRCAATRPRWRRA